MSETRYYPLNTTTKKPFDANEAVKKIGELKTGWHTSYNAGDKTKADEYANKAQEYYKQLRDNGYSQVADDLTNTNDVGAKYIVENFLKNNSAPTTTETPAVDTTTITGKVNDLYGIQKSDREKMAGKYDTLEDYNYNHNPYESDIGKSIMEDYKFKGKTASDNAVASGGADNGGNIDSYASANANRQQLAFTNAGKQAVLNDFNTRISNAKEILYNLGVYQQNQDKGMQTTIGLQQSEEQRVFDNEETKKNNQVDRDVKTSEVTGYVPESMSYSDNPFFNKDGTLINPDTTDYSQIITNAKNKLKTATDSAEKANLEATIKYATQARAYKILNMPEYSKWASTMELTSPDATLTSQVTNKELDNNKAIEDKKLDTTKELTEKEIDANERMNNATNATNVTVAGINASAKSKGEEDEVDWSDFSKVIGVSNNDIVTRNFIKHNIQPLIDEGLNITTENGEVYYTVSDENGKETTMSLKDFLTSNSSKMTKDGAMKIWDSLGGGDVTWVDKHTWYDPNGSGYTPE